MVCIPPDLSAISAEKNLSVGVYGSGPFLGNLVDKRGPRPLLTYSFIALFIGYYGTRTLYDQGAEDTISTMKLGLLILLGLATGTGGNAGLIAAVNTTAKSFPDFSVRTNPSQFLLFSIERHFREPRQLA